MIDSSSPPSPPLSPSRMLPPGVTQTSVGLPLGLRGRHVLDYVTCVTIGDNDRCVVQVEPSATSAITRPFCSLMRGMEPPQGQPGSFQVGSKRVYSCQKGALEKSTRHCINFSNSIKPNKRVLFVHRLPGSARH